MHSGISFQSYLVTMGAATIVAWMGWLITLFRVDPLETGILGLFLFYITLFTGLAGTFAVGGVLYRILILKRQDLVVREARISFRHGLMLALVAVVSLSLSAQSLLTWWNLLGVFLVIGIVEYVFLTMEESRRM